MRNGRADLSLENTSAPTHRPLRRQFGQRQRLVKMARAQGEQPFGIGKPGRKIGGLGGDIAQFLRIGPEIEEQRRQPGEVDIFEIGVAQDGEVAGSRGQAEMRLRRSARDIAEIERWLKKPDPIVLAIGTGRTLKAAVDQLPALDCPQHRVVSLTGNIGPDGSAAYYNVVFSMADAIKARHFPMPLPVLVSSAEERELLHQQALVRSTLALGAQADVTFVGVGELGPDAPLCVDGFLAADEMQTLIAAGAAGEICGWIFDGQGRLLNDPVNERVASVPIPSRETSVVIGIAMGKRKARAIAGALKGGLLNGLITDEATAEFLLNV